MIDHGIPTMEHLDDDLKPDTQCIKYAGDTTVYDVVKKAEVDITHSTTHTMQPSTLAKTHSRLQLFICL